MSFTYKKYFPYKNIRPQQTEAIDFILDAFVNQNKNYGQKIGVEYAECFEPVRYLF